MILLDTDVVSEPLRPAPETRVIQWIDAQPLETLILSAITVAELRTGVGLLPAGKRRAGLHKSLETRLLPLLAGRVLPFDLGCTQGYAELIAKARASGLAVASTDGYIAAIAVANGLAAATRDSAPFEAAGVAVINPWLVSAPIVGASRSPSDPIPTDGRLGDHLAQVHVGAFADVHRHRVAVVALEAVQAAGADVQSRRDVRRRRCRSCRGNSRSPRWPGRIRGSLAGMTPEPPVPTAIDWRDSEVSRIETVDRALVIALPVAAVRGRGSRYLRAVTLQLDEAEVLQRDDGCIGRLADGDLRVDGIALPVCLVPSAHDGRIELRLRFANGAAFASSGCALRLQAADGAGPVEHLHC